MKKRIDAIVLTAWGIITLPYGIPRAYYVAMNTLNTGAR